jgi:hypothetical protein
MGLYKKAQDHSNRSRNHFTEHGITRLIHAAQPHIGRIKTKAAAAAPTTATTTSATETCTYRVQRGRELGLFHGLGNVDDLIAGIFLVWPLVARSRHRCVVAATQRGKVGDIDLNGGAHLGLLLVVVIVAVVVGALARGGLTGAASSTTSACTVVMPPALLLLGVIILVTGSLISGCIASSL